MGAEHPRRLLQQAGLAPKKSLGQNFLVDEGPLRLIVTAADLSPADAVLEIGPGLGALTRLLAAEAGQVVAVELDDRLLRMLERELAGMTNVRLIHGDILEVDPAELLGAPYKVVANLPYYITAAILRHLLSARLRPQMMVLTVQSEVAQRLTAGPGEMSLLAVSVQCYGRVKQVAQIKAGAFYPRPEVDSAVVRVEMYPEPLTAGVDDDHFFRVVRAGFGQKRKQLRNSLRAGLSLARGEVEMALEAAGIDPRRRAETLSLDEWAGLAACLAS